MILCLSSAVALISLVLPLSAQHVSGRRPLQLTLFFIIEKSAYDQWMQWTGNNETQMENEVKATYQAAADTFTAYSVHYGENVHLRLRDILILNSTDFSTGNDTHTTVEGALSSLTDFLHNNTRANTNGSLPSAYDKRYPESTWRSYAFDHVILFTNKTLDVGYSGTKRYSTSCRASVIKSIVRIFGTYRTAVHLIRELGRVFGAKDHTASSLTQYPGYVMETTENPDSRNHAMFNHDSYSLMFLGVRNKPCMEYVSSNVQEEYSRLGQLLTEDQLCMREISPTSVSLDAFGTESPKECVNIFCRASSNESFAKIYAPDGATCGSLRNGTCLLGRCKGL